MQYRTEQYSAIFLIYIPTVMYTDTLTQTHFHMLCQLTNILIFILFYIDLCDMLGLNKKNICNILIFFLKYLWKINHFSPCDCFQETHILHNFKTDFYGSFLKVVLLGFIRPMKDYGSLGKLVEVQEWSQ